MVRRNLSQKSSNSSFSGWGHEARGLIPEEESSYRNQQKTFEIYIHYHAGYSVVPLYMSVLPYDEILAFFFERRVSWELEAKSKIRIH
uniref:Autophagy_act_C domain-containing protein n=1 Tax=Caenorhabditis tropicalis TaxID=1561998 RepID=A0A1I7U1Y1_9PELO